MVKVKTLIEAKEAIDQLLEMHLQAVLSGKDFEKKHEESKPARARAFKAYLDLKFAIAPHLAKEIKVSND